MSPDCRLIVHSTSSAVRTWVEAEVADLVPWRQYTTTIRDAVAAFGRGIASADDVLIVDLDRISVDQIAELRMGIDACWWRGTIVGLGRERHRHTRALTIAHSIPRPFGSERLRAHIAGGSRRDTQPHLAATR